MEPDKQEEEKPKEQKVDLKIRTDGLRGGTWASPQITSPKSPDGEESFRVLSSARSRGNLNVGLINAKRTEGMCTFRC